MALKEMCWAATEAVLQDHNILVLSDRGQTETRAPMPALLATAAVHHRFDPHRGIDRHANRRSRQNIVDIRIRSMLGMKRG